MTLSIRVIPLGREKTLFTKPKNWSEIRTLLLAAEILSPATARADRTLKRTLYQREGVGEYWVVDLDARRVGAGEAG